MVPDTLRDRSLETLSLIAERLRDPGHVTLAVEHAKKQSDEFFWGGASLASGFGSLALFYLYLARSFPGHGWEELAHTYLRLTAQATQEIPLLYPGLLTGSSGFGLLLATFYHDEPRYQKMFERTCTSIVEQIMDFVVARETEAHRISNRDYELIAGAAGMLAFLLSLPSPPSLVQGAIQKLLGYLIWISEEEQRWFTAPDHLPGHEYYHKHYPHGYFNISLSHGIPGSLAALSLAWQAEYRAPGQREAIERICRWVVEHQVHDQWGINWPGGVPLEASSSPQLWKKLPATRTAWCYGAPGLASALWMAGQALTDESMKQIAREGLEAVLRRPTETRGIFSPTLCHGVGGLLAICLRFAQVPEHQVIREHLPRLVTQVLDACSPSFLLGVRDEARPETFVDDPGLLTGAVGVALVLLAVATSVEPAWDRVLLLS